MTTPRKARRVSRPAPTAAAADLRVRAEARLGAQPPTGPHADAELHRLVHELQVHQVELEMQNEELHRAHEAREDALQKYADLYDFAPVGYVSLDAEGVVRESNIAGARLLGLDRAQLVRRRFGLQLTVTDRTAFTAFLDRVFASHTMESCEVNVFSDRGLATELRIDAIADDGGKECRAVLRDITGLKQAELDREVISKLESTRTLAEGLSHDFNNLLTVIVLNLDLAQTTDPSDGRQADLLAAAKRCAVVASSLIHQLMTFAQHDAPVRKPSHLNAVLRKSVQSDSTASPCHLVLSDDLWLVEVDEPQITEVIHNLVANARDAMPLTGTVTIRTQNVVLPTGGGPSLPAGNYVRITVADEGGGIAPAVRPRIFDPYFSTKTRGNQKGMGLGLAICLAVIHSHGGSIALDPATGAGALFHLYLPALPERAPLPLAS